MSIFTSVVAVPVLRRLLMTARRTASKSAVVRPILAAVSGAIVLMCLLPVAGATAADYPTKSVTIIVPYPPGGRTDLVGRAVAQSLQAELGQPVVVVNKPGASGVLGAKEVASAPPDGYTLGVFSTGFLTAQYTVPTPTNVADYELIAQVNLDPAVIAVPEQRGWKTLSDFLSYARANPGKLRVGIDAGSSAQIFAAAFVEKAKLDVIYVPFRGGGERTVALAGGHIDADFDILAPLKTMREAKKVRVLGVAENRRVAEYSDVPTMEEGGVDLKISSWHGVFAPRGTPSAIVAKLSSALKNVTSNPEFQTRMRNLLLGVRYRDSKGFREYFAEQDKLNLALIKKLGLLVSQKQK